MLFSTSITNLLYVCIAVGYFAMGMKGRKPVDFCVTLFVPFACLETLLKLGNESAPSSHDLPPFLSLPPTHPPHPTSLFSSHPHPPRPALLWLYVSSADEFASSLGGSFWKVYFGYGSVGGGVKGGAHPPRYVVTARNLTRRLPCRCFDEVVRCVFMCVYSIIRWVVRWKTLV